MAYQAPWRLQSYMQQRHALRVRNDAFANDPTVTPEERAFRIERLRSSHSAAEAADREHDEATLVMQVALAEDPMGEDAAFFKIHNGKG